jgi:hypothetical protein
MRTDEQTDITKLTAAVSNFADAPIYVNPKVDFGLFLKKYSTSQHLKLSKDSR